MRSRIDFNDDWLFDGATSVRLPHNAVQLPYSYFDERTYQRPFTYEKTFAADPAWNGKEVALLFGGAMANAKVSLNGERLCEHADGFTPFEVRLTDALRDGENTITVSIDGSENPAIPPFGGVIDYLTYAGIYREACLKVTAPLSIANLKIETPDVLAERKTVVLRAEIANPRNLDLAGALKAELRNADGDVVADTEVAVDADMVRLRIDDLSRIALWHIDNPALYTLELRLETPHGSDTTATRFGFRAAEFNAEGFWLNGRPLKLRGLNRHQSFPYVGFAMGRAAQERDAEILKRELKLNIVRTSHYPQSTHFLTRCDEIGLLVFEEIPGWQHIGDAGWRAESVENVRRMIRRDWNHPSIVLWGVRINESADSRDFYVETNRVARDLDPTRPTGGVRCITDSEFLEDVYTMNDFILGNEERGGNRPRTPLRPQREVTGLAHAVPYLVTEYCGHMYPTKSYDQEQRQAEHALRHLQVMDAAYGDPQMAGAIGWCAFDYNTHKDFGAGDRVCYHGVMDMFREPKFAAYAYASQCDPDEEIVLKPVTFWTRGERNIGGVLPLLVLTNCDEIEMRYGANPPKRIPPDRENFPNLPHPPVVVDDRHVTQADLGEWGRDWQNGTISGFVGGRKVAETLFAANPVPTTLELTADTQRMGRFESVRAMVRVLDQAGNKVPFLFDSVAIAISGPAELVGPDVVPLRGGSVGFWLASTGSGTVSVEVSHPRLGAASAEIVSE